jgi:hypothetical protein
MLSVIDVTDFHFKSEQQSSYTTKIKQLGNNFDTTAREKYSRKLILVELTGLSFILQGENTISNDLSSDHISDHSC